MVKEMARLTIEHFRDVWKKEQKKGDKAKLKAGKWYCVNSDDFGAENCLHWKWCIVPYAGRGYGVAAGTR